ncbi:DsbA family oxidoreductase [Paraburkholderia sp. BL10I2N1]|uniref:DsbA family oxidoreductase n=1 Tax=Paraburkholderia sp. BL10I2N1 TaxID=1938796 RepID=UPI0010E36FAF|nr:DsbA family oxidoreductase [Paraburkholderia sp. BL10I2N1]TDN57846.1 putative DsbA family dithiol-disulfide isomerase [Paraburkholderia sp. BL10I2N1]
MNLDDLERGAAAGEPRGLTVEVYFDFICPWCLIGKRNLEAAIRQLAEVRPDVRVEVSWISHQLLPDTPASGIPYQSFYVARLGSPEAVAARRAQVQRAGDAAGVRFAFDRIELLPNTTGAHRLFAWARAQGIAAGQAAVVERLFAAYFVHGENISDPGVLAQIGAECGLDRDAWLLHLREQPDGSRLPERRSLEAQRGVDGVPYFVFNGRFSLSGAQSSEAMLHAIMCALRESVTKMAKEY